MAPTNRELEEAFQGALGKYENWGGDPEPAISLNKKPVLISGICDLVVAMDIKDRMPDEVFRMIHWFMHAQHQALKQELGQDPSYATAARCLLQLIAEHRELYARQRLD